MVVSTESTLSGAASVLTPTGPIGQSELSMSMVCWARRPCGVLVSIWSPASAAFAGGVGGGRAAATSAATSAAVARQRRGAVPHRAPALLACAGPGNVQHNLELQQ